MPADSRWVYNSGFKGLIFPRTSLLLGFISGMRKNDLVSDRCDFCLLHSCSEHN